MPLIELRDESAGYSGTAVLHGLTLNVEAGERIALVGESGAGKSALLRLIYERCGPEAALVPQELGLVQALTVKRAIRFDMARSTPTPFSSIRAKGLNLFDVSRYIDRRIAGMIRRG
jgi:phosphonate transport system ATP-binding protein